MNAIEINGLTKKYGKITAVNGVSLSVKEGELFALLGVNGAGKSTLIRCLTCISAPDSGDATVGGYSITRERQLVKSRIAVSPQSTAVAPNLTVSENLTLMARLSGFSKDDAGARTGELLASFGLETVARQRAGTLSGGWQRRLSLAMALISEPSILFLDEPTLGLDVLARAELWDIIRSLKGRVTVVLTTHYMEEAEMLADRVGIMTSGNLIALGTPRELIRESGASRFEDAFVRIVKEAGK